MFQINKIVWEEDHYVIYYWVPFRWLVHHVFTPFGPRFWMFKDLDDVNQYLKMIKRLIQINIYESKDQEN